ncbi:phage portal protein [Konateibacter massiliensis]|uniref:phage portal protein n=1 Tax=Konateibacter massiliensis TaxID=2002841 RepID=UPI001F31484C|nr:phage portal protein [Konateibacter massiliensis]
MNGTKFIDYLFHGKQLRMIDSYFKMLNGYSPTFTSFNGGVYEMDLTRTAVNSFATHCSKLKPEITGSAYKHLERTLQFKPNYFMDTVKFIKRVATIVAVEHTAFIVPIEDELGGLCGWYPLRAQRCEVVEAAGQVYLRYLFANGEHGAIEFEKVGIMTDFEYSDDLFGEDNSTLKPTMQLIHTQNEGIINAVKNSANIRFLAKIANMLKPEDIQKERERFTEENLSADNKSGMIIYDNKFSELKQVESKPYTPNAMQMQQIQDNVCTHFGTNMDILQNKFNEETWNAYYEGKIEPFAIQLSLVMSNMTYTQRQIACNNAITFSANRLQYASNTTKLQVSTQLFDRALLNRNGVMDIWNMAHVEDGEKYYIRKEYTEVSELGKNDKPPIPAVTQQPPTTEQPPQVEPQATEEPEKKEGVTDAN